VPNSLQARDDNVHAESPRISKTPCSKKKELVSGACFIPQASMRCCSVLAVFLLLSQEGASHLATTETPWRIYTAIAHSSCWGLELGAEPVISIDS
jgi:hypothetical protein